MSTTATETPARALEDRAHAHHAHIHTPPPADSWLGAMWGLFLGDTANWYKFLVLAFLVLNPVLLAVGVTKFAVGWLVMGQFITFLAMALKCYPLLPGGLLVIESLALGLGTPEGMYKEAHHNFPVILLLMFVVAGVSFLREWLQVVFTRILTRIRSKVLLSLTFVLSGAVLSAFLDALTVISVIITVGIALNKLYNDYRSRQQITDDEELEQFRAFLRSLFMHAAVGTMLGGVLTKVGEPQNLLIAHIMESTVPAEFAKDWTFFGFMVHMAPVTVPTFIVGLLVCVLVERFRAFGYGTTMPTAVRSLLEYEAAREYTQRTKADAIRLNAQLACAVLLVVGLGTHIAEVGILGVFLIVLATTFTGVSEEHRIGEAFTFALPFCALLVVFFGIVEVIEHNHLFQPVVEFALAQQAQAQLLTFFAASGLLSSISDNVFVATVFINEATSAFKASAVDVHQFEKLAIAVNTGTNIPSIATPNGQAAFLFLLTSPLAPLIRLGYVRMIWMALPYTILVTIVATAAVWWLL